MFVISFSRIFELIFREGMRVKFTLGIPDYGQPSFFVGRIGLVNGIENWVLYEIVSTNGIRLKISSKW